MVFGLDNQCCVLMQSSSAAFPRPKKMHFPQSLGQWRQVISHHSHHSSTSQVYIITSSTSQVYIKGFSLVFPSFFFLSGVCRCWHQRTTEQMPCAHFHGTIYCHWMHTQPINKSCNPSPFTCFRHWFKIKRFAPALG